MAKEKEILDKLKKDVWVIQVKRVLENLENVIAFAVGENMILTSSFFFNEDNHISILGRKLRESGFNRSLRIIESSPLLGLAMLEEVEGEPYDNVTFCKLAENGALRIKDKVYTVTNYRGMIGVVFSGTVESSCIDFNALHVLTKQPVSTCKQYMPPSYNDLVTCEYQKVGHLFNRINLDVKNTELSMRYESELNCELPCFLCKNLVFGSQSAGGSPVFNVETEVVGVLISDLSAHGFTALHVSVISFFMGVCREKREEVKKRNENVDEDDKKDKKEEDVHEKNKDKKDEDVREKNKEKNDEDVREKNKDKMDGDALMTVLSLLIAHLGDKSSMPVAEQCGSTLGHVAGEGEELKKVLLFQGALPPLARMMLRDKCLTVRTAAWALSNLIKGPEPKAATELIRIEGVVDAITRHLRKADEELATEIAWAVVYLSAVSNFATGVMVKKDPLQLLVERLTTSDSLQLHIPILQSLGNLVATDAYTTNTILIDRNENTDNVIAALAKCLKGDHRVLEKLVMLNTKLIFSRETTPALLQLGVTALFPLEGGARPQLIFEHLVSLVRRGCFPGFIDLVRSADTKGARLGLQFLELVLRECRWKGSKASRGTGSMPWKDFSFTITMT